MWRCVPSATSSSPSRRTRMDDPRHTIESVFRRESGRIVATLIRVSGSFDLAEEAMQDACTAALTYWPVKGVPDNPAAWLTAAAHRKLIDYARREQTRRKQQGQLQYEIEAAHSDPSPEPGIGPGRHRRPAQPHLHLLPSRAPPRSADRPHPAHPRRPHHRRNRPRLSRAGGHPRPAPGARQTQNPRGRHPVPRAFAKRPPGAPLRRPDGLVSHLQRRLHGHLRRHSHPPRALRRSHPSRPPAL